MFTFEPNSGSGIQYILIEFEMILDIDFGVLKTLADEYQVEELFSTGLMEVEDRNIWLGLIHDNKTKNPVNCFITSDFEDEADGLYEAIMEEHEELVYDNSTITGMNTFIHAACASEGLAFVTIVCKTPLQQKIAKAMYSSISEEYCKTILIDPNSEDQLDAKEYTSLFLRYADSMFDYDNLDNKAIFLYQCYHNIDMELYKRKIGIYPNRLLSALHSQFNNIRVIALYEYDNSYFANRNYPFDTSGDIYDEKIDRYLDPGHEIPKEDVEDDMAVEEYETYLQENGIPIDLPEEELIEEYEDMEVDMDHDIDLFESIDELIEDSIPIMDDIPTIKLEEEDDNE